VAQPKLLTLSSPPQAGVSKGKATRGLSFRRAMPYIGSTGKHGATMKLSDVVWTDDDGKVISCAEKNKVLKENLREIRQVCQDAFEDALLMGCSEHQIRAVFAQLVAGLENPYNGGPDKGGAGR
jgi:hypothetical protein